MMHVAEWQESTRGKTAENENRHDDCKALLAKNDQAA